ncbi:hypothetical protein I4F81_005353 [Pyropia yezoensis]|uniref:Uncharacterized protein n=1 Tax=Pyropia yezoensis TaxID=2788 RepID=A0ACC3BXM5_PYRYE|nr:hypothetical protein I4F81_005353 [Neopyropia yezoensis]
MPRSGLLSALLHVIASPVASYFGRVPRAGLKLLEDATVTAPSCRASPGRACWSSATAAAASAASAAASAATAATTAAAAAADPTAAGAADVFGGDDAGAAGAPLPPPDPPHAPVLVDEIVAHFAGRPLPTSLDGTVGAGGHAAALLSAAAIGHYVAIDRDAAALALAQARLAPIAAAAGTRLTFLHGNFSDAPALLAAAAIPLVDGLLLDYGVISIQLDTPARGFSFLRDGPLDMGMDGCGAGPTAADVVNGWSEADLGAAIRELGEERHWRGIAASIVAARAAAVAAGRVGLTTTAELAAVVAGGRRLNERRVHPATLTFQALRMVVDAEAAAVAALPRVLGSVAAWAGAR